MIWQLVPQVEQGLGGRAPALLEPEKCASTACDRTMTATAKSMTITAKTMTITAKTMTTTAKTMTTTARTENEAHPLSHSRCHDQG